FYVPRRRRRRCAQQQPEEAVRRKSEEIRQITDGRERVSTHQLHRHEPLVLSKLELDRLRSLREIGDAQHDLIVELANISNDLAMARTEKLERAAPEAAELSAHGENPPCPVEE